MTRDEVERDLVIGESCLPVKTIFLNFWAPGDLGFMRNEYKFLFLGAFEMEFNKDSELYKRIDGANRNVRK